MSIANAAIYLKDTTIGAGSLLRHTVVRVCLSCCTVIALIWVAVLMYISFYYAYMPTVHHAQPVFLKFSTDCDKKPQNGLCSFPEANVTLSKGERILMRGQKYQVFLDLDMPYSPVNEQLGMFMVSVKFLSNSGKMVAKSSRSCMLHFRSGPLKLLHTIFMFLPLVLGFTEEKQNLAVNVFENYVDDSYHPVSNVNIVVLAKHIEIYGAFLRIEAQFSGFRFILFNWPMSSALVCISANFIVICIVFFFAYNAFTPEPTEQIAVEMETDEDGQERLYGEARRRDLGTSERRVPRSPIRIVPPVVTPGNGRSRHPTIHKRNRVANVLHNTSSSTHLLPPCHNTLRRSLRSASFPSCRWEPTGSRVGKAVRSTSSALRGDGTPLYIGFPVGNTQGHPLHDYTRVKDNRDSEDESAVDSQQNNPNLLTKECDLKAKDFSVSNKVKTKKGQNIKRATEMDSIHEGKTAGKPVAKISESLQKLSVYTIIEPKSGKKYYSYSDFKNTNAVKKFEPVRDEHSNIKMSLYGYGNPNPDTQKSSITGVKPKRADERYSGKEEEKKSILRRRSTSKSRSKFGLSFKSMLHRK